MIFQLSSFYQTRRETITAIVADCMTMDIDNPLHAKLLEGTKTYIHTGKTQAVESEA